MNLNGESGDWDNLQKNVDLVIADVSDDYGWNFLLSYGVIAEPVEIVGKRRKEIIQYRRLAAEVLGLRWALAIPREMEIDVEIPLGILVTDTPLILECALGIPRVQEMQMETPISLMKYNLGDLEISLPLIVFRSLSMDVEIPIGNTLKQSRKKLRKLKKTLEHLDEV